MESDDQPNGPCRLGDVAWRDRPRYIHAMLGFPTFASRDDQVLHVGDVDLWRPYLAEILRRHDLADFGREPAAGFNATYPTFVCGDVVVKLFGGFSSWRVAHACERAALALVTTDPDIAAPRMFGEGVLFDGREEAWPYLITARVTGVASSDADLSDRQRVSLAGDLGKQVKRIHTLDSSGVPTLNDWQTVTVTAAAERSSLPAHLVAQVDDYIAGLGSSDNVFVHGDLCANHVFVDDGHLAGIIDWGDAVSADRHYEIIQLYRDMFACDKALLCAFLDASDWPVTKDFADRAMGYALYRQAVGLAQHRGMDVFELVAERFPLHEIETLGELAKALFAV